MSLRIRNKTPQKIVYAFLSSMAIIILFGIGILISLIAQKDTAFLAKGIIIFSLILLSVWLICLLSACVFHKTVTVTREAICLHKGRKIIWTIQKEEILQCMYSKIFANKKFYPEAGVMYFKLKSNGSYAKKKIKNGLYVDKYIGLSYKNMQKLVKLGYNVSITNEIIEKKKRI